MLPWLWSIRTSCCVYRNLRLLIIPRNLDNRNKIHRLLFENTYNTELKKHYHRNSQYLKRTRLSLIIEPSVVSFSFDLPSYKSQDRQTKPNPSWTFLCPRTRRVLKLFLFETYTFFHAINIFQEFTLRFSDTINGLPFSPIHKVRESILIAATLFHRDHRRKEFMFQLNQRLSSRVFQNSTIELLKTRWKRPRLFLSPGDLITRRLSIGFHFHMVPINAIN